MVYKQRYSMGLFQAGSKEVKREEVYISVTFIPNGSLELLYFMCYIYFSLMLEEVWLNRPDHGGSRSRESILLAFLFEATAEFFV